MDIDYPVLARDVGVVDLTGEVLIGATGAVGTSTALGFAVTRVSQGLYRCTLSRLYPEMLYANAVLMHATQTDATFHLKLRTMSTGLIEFFYAAAGSNADPPDGSTIFIFLRMKDSTVAP